MKFTFVYGMLPALVCYTDHVPEGSAGCANAMIVRIRPGYRDDVGLLQHELTHVKQAYRLLFLFHALLYLLDDSYRLHAEVEAYGKQLEYSSDKNADAARFAESICNKYNLHVDQTSVENMLRGE